MISPFVVLDCQLFYLYHLSVPVERCFQEYFQLCLQVPTKRGVFQHVVTNDLFWPEGLLLKGLRASSLPSREQLLLRNWESSGVKWTDGVDFVAMMNERTYTLSKLVCLERQILLGEILSPNSLGHPRIQDTGHMSSVCILGDNRQYSPASINHLSL